MTDDPTFKERITRQGEDAVGRLAQDLLESPILSGMLTAVFETRERAMRAQEVAMGALNLPSAGDLERLTRRVRSVSQRLEGIEDGLDRVEDRLARPAPAPAPAAGPVPAPDQADLDERLSRIESALSRLELQRAQLPAPAAVKKAPAKTPTKKSAPARRAAAKRAPAKRVT